MGPASFPWRANRRENSSFVNPSFLLAETVALHTPPRGIGALLLSLIFADEYQKKCVKGVIELSSCKLVNFGLALVQVFFREIHMYYIDFWTWNDSML
jgi:hypothetical protein